MTRRLSVRDATRLLASGALVAVPTDTVYGVAGAIREPGEPRRLFTLKARPEGVALPILGASLEQFAELGVALDEDVRRLARRFWPGALTIVLSAPQDLAARVGSTDHSVGLRVPKDATLLGVLRSTGPLAVTSANRHGAAPCQSASDIDAVFSNDEALAGVLDDGPRRGVVSTVLDVRTRPWRVLREGALSRDELGALSAETGLL